MANAVKRASAGANVVFGVSGITVTGTVVQGYQNSYSSQKAEVADTTGITVGAAWYDLRKSITVDALFNNATALTFAPGDAVTIDNVASFIDSFEILQANTDWKKVRFACTAYENTLS